MVKFRFRIGARLGFVDHAGVAARIERRKVCDLFSRMSPRSTPAAPRTRKAMIQIL
jgi:hypothetical protein